MISRCLVLVSALSLAAAASAEEAPASKPKTRMALTGDFVELGAGHPGVSRKLAAVEIVNRSPHPIDLKLGYGAGRIDPGKSLFVRINPGEQPLEISSPKAPGDVLTAELHLQKGRAYALGIAWEEVLVDGRASTARPVAKPMKPRADATPATSAKTEGKTVEKGPTWDKKKKRSGRVDIGRKRKKDR